MNRDDPRVNEIMVGILDGIPARLDIRGVLLDAHQQLAAACPEHPDLVAQKVAEVLREIAAHAVEEYESRTGQSLYWDALDAGDLAIDAGDLAEGGV